MAGLAVAVGACSSPTKSQPATTTIRPPTTVAATLPPIDTERLTAEVTRDERALRLAVATSARCAASIEACSSDKQQALLNYYSAVRRLRDTLTIVDTSGRTPPDRKALVTDTAAAADAVLALLPDPRKLVCGPGSPGWPSSENDCTALYKMLAAAGRKLADTIDLWQ